MGIPHVLKKHLWIVFLARLRKYDLYVQWAVRVSSIFSKKRYHCISLPHLLSFIGPGCIYAEWGRWRQEDTGG